MAAAELTAPQGRVVFGPARRIAGRIPPTLEMVDVLVANVEPQHAAPLVKVLARDLPLGQLQHLKRVRRRDGCKGAAPQMQLILHTVASLRSMAAAGDETVARGKRISIGAKAGSGAGGGADASSVETGQAGGGEAAHTPGSKGTPSAGAPKASDGGSAGSTCTCFAAHHTHRHPTTHVVVPPPQCTGRCAACNGTATSNAADPQQQQHQQSPAAPSPAAAAPRPPLRSATPAAADAERYVPPRIAAALVTAGAELDVARVPGVAPDNRDQWTEWSKIWPMPWKLPSGQPHQDGQTATQSDQAYFEAHMSRVIAMSAAAGGANVCVIVNPANGEIIAEAVDGSAVHPLKHASMQAVSAAAERDLRLWPVNGFVHLGRQEDTSMHGVNTIISGAGEELVGSNGGSASGDDGQQEQGQQQEQQQQQDKAQEHLIAGLKHCHSQGNGLGVDTPAKRQRVKGASNSSSHGEPQANGQNQQQQNGNGKQEEAANGHPAKANGSAAANGNGQQQHRPPRQSSSTPSLDSAASGGRSAGGSRVPTPVPLSSWANKPYLCNTYDAFLLREPCAMCGMALVHSRLARVVYCDADPAHGALGGAFRLQANRSLNHHYDVFHMPLDRSGGANGATAADAEVQPAA